MLSIGWNQLRKIKKLVPSPLFISLNSYSIYFINQGFDYVQLTSWPYAKTSILFDRTHPVLPKDIEKYKKKTKPKGGVLADEMGLGYVL